MDQNQPENTFMVGKCSLGHCIPYCLSGEFLLFCSSKNRLSAARNEDSSHQTTWNAYYGERDKIPLSDIDKIQTVIIFFSYLKLDKESEKITHHLSRIKDLGVQNDRLKKLVLVIEKGEGYNENHPPGFKPPSNILWEVVASFKQNPIKIFIYAENIDEIPRFIDNLLSFVFLSLKIDNFCDLDCGRLSNWSSLQYLQLKFVKTSLNSGLIKVLTNMKQLKALAVILQNTQNNELMRLVIDSLPEFKNLQFLSLSGIPKSYVTLVLQSPIINRLLSLVVESHVSSEYYFDHNQTQSLHPLNSGHVKNNLMKLLHCFGTQETPRNLIQQIILQSPRLEALILPGVDAEFLLFIFENLKESLKYLVTHNMSENKVKNLEVPQNVSLWLNTVYEPLKPDFLSKISSKIFSCDELGCQCCH